MGNSSSTKLRKDFKKLLKRLPVLKKEVQDDDLLVFIGRTRCGKSSSICSILGVNLTGVEAEDLLGQYKIEEPDNTNSDIAHGSSSFTDDLKVHKNKHYDPQTKQVYTIIDTPGFEDNRIAVDVQAPIQETMNNILLYFLVKYAKTVKFVLVSDINDIIHDDKSNFVHFMTQVQMLLPNFESVKCSMTILFTKGKDAYNISNIVKFMKTARSLGITTEPVRKFLDFFIENESQIAFFKMPKTTGLIDNTVKDNIQQAINNSKAIKVEDLNVPLSTEASGKIAQLIDEMLEEIDFTEDLAYLSNKYKQYKSSESLKEVDDGVLNNVHNQLKDAVKLCDKQKDQKLENFSDIRTSMESLSANDISEKVLNILELLEIFDTIPLIKKIHKNKIITQFKNAVMSTLSKIENIYVTVTSEIARRKHKSDMIKCGVCVGAGVLAVGAIAAGGFMLAPVVAQAMAGGGGAAAVATGVEVGTAVAAGAEVGTAVVAGIEGAVLAASVQGATATAGASGIAAAVNIPNAAAAVACSGSAGTLAAGVVLGGAVACCGIMAMKSGKEADPEKNNSAKK